MISPQNLAIAAATVGCTARRETSSASLPVEPDVPGRMCVLVYLQSTAVLGWMSTEDDAVVNLGELVGDSPR